MGVGVEDGVDDGVGALIEVEEGWREAIVGELAERGLVEDVCVGEGGRECEQGEGCGVHGALLVGEGEGCTMVNTC